eukprot:COSAG01_NODE_7835_length_3034_cov_2.171380_2_plen_180_part_00
MVVPVPVVGVPCGHVQTFVRHTLAPARLYLPAAHAVHADAPVAEALDTAGANCPAMQLPQLVAPVVPANFPPLQVEQVAEPAEPMYLPAAHAVHADAPVAEALDTAGANCPAMQLLHLVAPVVPANFPPLQVEHVAEPAEPIYCPVEQAMQALELDAPVPERYRPVEHSVHEACPVADW